MKILIVGGMAQGKRFHAQQAYGIPLLDGETCDFSEISTANGIDRLHFLVRRMLEQGLDPVEKVLDSLADRTDWLFLCDEIGSGVVPIDAFDRTWREAVGRLCCALSSLADCVERVVCGIAVPIKGESL